MANLLEYVGNVHIFLGPYRGNPIALYLMRGANGCEIAPKVYPWNDVVGKGETPNRAAADFEEKWKAKGLSPEMSTGPAWQGVKPEKPAPPKPPAAAKPATPAAGTGGESKPPAATAPAKPEEGAAATGAESKAAAPKPAGAAAPSGSDSKSAAPAKPNASAAKPSTQPVATTSTKAPVTAGESNSPKGQST